MKVIRDGAAYVQKNDIVRLMHSGSMIPTSIFDNIFQNGCFTVVGDDRYEFVEFDDDDDIDFFKCLDWVVDYDELNKLNETQIVELGNKIVNEQNKIAEAYNFMTEFERKKHQELIEKYELLEHKLDSITAFALFKRGEIEMQLPECVSANTYEKDKSKGIKKLIKSFF